MAIDIETGAYEIDTDELTASDHLLARVPGAQIWLQRIGCRLFAVWGRFRSQATHDHHLASPAV